MAAFRAAAIAGTRCPGNDELSDLVYAAGGKRWRESLDELTASGMIRIEISGKNWRTVYLLCENLNTAKDPDGRPTYLVLDQAGKRRV